MAGFNVRGGDPTSYVLGRGRLFVQGDIKRFVGGTLQAADAGWRDVGNVTAFTVTQESETKEHKSSLEGIQIIDLEVPVSQRMTVSFTLDELNNVNLARFFSGDLLDGALGFGSPTLDGLGNASALASDDGTFMVGKENVYVDTATTDQVINMWYDLTLDITVLGGVFNAIDFEPQATQAIAVYKNSTARATLDGTLLTEGTHYELDRKMGRIRFLSAAGGLARGDIFQVHWAAPTTPKSATAPGIDTKLSFIKLLTNSGVSVALKFIGENPNNGDVQSMLEFFKVKLKPDGEYAGIGDDWAQVSFTGAVESITNPPPGASKYGRMIIRSEYST